MNTPQRNLASRFGLAFSLADAGMTAGFGFLAYSSLTAKVMFAGIYGLMSLCLALIIPIAIAWALNDGKRATAGLLGALLLVGSIVNQITNVGFTSTMMGSEIHGNRVSNNRAAIASDTLGVLKDRHAKITAELVELDQGGKLEPPAAYAARIETLKNETENGRNIYARSKSCTDTTLKTSQIVCQGIRQAERTLANAERKVQLEREVAGLLPRLSAASDKSEEKQEQFSPIVAQMKTVSTMWTLSLAPDKDSQDWTVLWFALALSLLISALAIACNIIGATRSIEDARVIDGGTLRHSQRLIASDAPVEQRSREAMGDAGRYVERRETVIRTRDGKTRAFPPGLAAALDAMERQSEANRQILEA